MMRLFDKGKNPDVTSRVTHCTDCGCAIESHHWRNCPRCQKEIVGSGCQGCGNCGGH